MILLGIVKDNLIVNNQITVRIPSLESAGNKTEYLCKCAVGTQPGVNPNYQINDIVYVSFVGKGMTDTFIIGKFYKAGEESVGGKISAEILNIISQANLPESTNIGNISGKDLKNALNQIEIINRKIKTLETSSSGGDDYVAGNGINISQDNVISVDLNGNTLTVNSDGLKVNTNTIQEKLIPGNNITINGNVINTSANEVSVSATGTSTDKVKYITIDGEEKKIGGDEYTEGFGININNNQISVDTTEVPSKEYVDSELDDKQGKLTPGANITIDEDGVISATNTTYTASGGISINNGNIELDFGTSGPTNNSFLKWDDTNNRLTYDSNTYQKELVEGNGININSSTNVISVDETTVQHKLTAGNNIQINGNTISATDTTYIEGEGIKINSNKIHLSIPVSDTAPTLNLITGSTWIDTSIPVYSRLNLTRKQFTEIVGETSQLNTTKIYKEFINNQHYEFEKHYKVTVSGQQSVSINIPSGNYVLYLTKRNVTTKGPATDSGEVGFHTPIANHTAVGGKLTFSSSSAVSSVVVYCNSYNSSASSGYVCDIEFTIKLIDNITMIKYNLWDEDWEAGYYNLTNGTDEVSNDNVRSKTSKPIPVKQNTKYYCNSEYIRWCYYDKDMHFLGSSGLDDTQLITTPNNCSFVKFYLGGGYGFPYKNDIYIYQVIENLVANSPSSSPSATVKEAGDNYIITMNNATYAGLEKKTTSTLAYGDYRMHCTLNYNTTGVNLQIGVYNQTKSIYILSSTSVLDKTFTITPANYSPGDEIYFWYQTFSSTAATGEVSINNYYVTKIDDSLKWGYVDLGSLTWTRDSSGNISWFGASMPNARPIASYDDIHRTYVYATGYTTATVLKPTLAEILTNDLMIVRKDTGVINDAVRIRNDSYTTVESFKTAMSGKILMYEKDITTVNLGTLTYVVHPTYTYAYYAYPDVSNMNKTKPVEAKGYTYTTSSVSGMTDKTIKVSDHLYIRDDSVNDAEELKYKLTGVILYYHSN